MDYLHVKFGKICEELSIGMMQRGHLLFLSKLFSIQSWLTTQKNKAYVHQSTAEGLNVCLRTLSCRDYYTWKPKFLTPQTAASNI